MAISKWKGEANWLYHLWDCGVKIVRPKHYIYCAYCIVRPWLWHIFSFDFRIFGQWTFPSIAHASGLMISWSTVHRLVAVWRCAHFSSYCPEPRPRTAKDRTVPWAYVQHQEAKRLPEINLCVQFHFSLFGVQFC